MACTWPTGSGSLGGAAIEHAIKNGSHWFGDFDPHTAALAKMSTGPMSRRTATQTSATFGASLQTRWLPSTSRPWTVATWATSGSARESGAGSRAVTNRGRYLRAGLPRQV